jgi:ABC-type Fe3+ transport system substrate-binding protein
VDGTPNAAAAESFTNFTLTTEAQQAIGETGWQPIRDDVEWEAGGNAVTPDWDAGFERQDELLEQYRTIFGG